jgi:hypothetical protein
VTARAREPGANTVAIVLSVGMCTALNLFVVAVLLDALFSAGPGLSENATQILTGWGGGIVGVVGAVVGYKSGEASGRSQAATSASPNRAVHAATPSSEPITPGRP